MSDIHRPAHSLDTIATLCEVCDGYWPCEMAQKDAEIERLREDLTTIATHWPGKWTRYCCECEDEPWPCQPALDAVVPYMGDEDSDE